MRRMLDRIAESSEHAAFLMIRCWQCFAEVHWVCVVAGSKRLEPSVLTTRREVLSWRAISGARLRLSRLLTVRARVRAAGIKCAAPLALALHLFLRECGLG